ncbi:hypothetical protein [Alkalihalobacillus sp. LMS39]|uniref:hypothetical protein n=1 Tax=Alkalihalobacillus sp. LMS39 TaxID=2924032 RepID=UPI001FB51536|nr:hypothetical protein [Alkalihalobacillus sp. LMS39]UOE92521.1 hypothetical protein MM271_14880 [Alkalihalobacillus sp. LMS39]
MYAWLHLAKKEWRLGLPAFIMPILVFIIIASIAVFIGSRYGFGIDTLIGISLLATGIQVFYLAYYLFYSLLTERKKLHLWLHNPMSGVSLLLAKISAGLASLLPTLLLTTTVLLVSLHFSQLNSLLSMSSIYSAISFVILHIFLISIQFGVCLLLFFVIYLVLSQYFHSFISFLLTILLIAVSAGLYGWFTLTIYESITSWGEIPLPLLTDISILASPEGSSVHVGAEDTSIFIGTYFFETLFTFAIFFGACWILDHKVEV